MSDQTRTQGRNPERGDLTLTDQRPLDADVVVEDAPIASTDLWRAIATPSDHSDFDDVLRRALQALMDDYESIPWATLAAETGLDDVLDGMVTQLLRQWTRGDEMAAWRVLRLLRQLGGPTSLGYSSSLDDVHTVVEAVFGWTDVTPTVTVVLDREFFDAKHNQRERFLRFVTGLAVGCDVRLVGTPGVLTQLAQAHDQDLPTSAVTEWTQRRRRRAATASRRRDAEAALDALGWDHPAWDTLATIAAPAAEQRPYSALYALSEVTESAVRHQLLRLDEAGLIERISLNGERVASVLPPGLEVLDLLADLRDPDGAGDPAQARLGAGGPIVSDASDAETARRLDDVNDPPKGGVGPCSPNARGTPPRPAGRRTVRDLAPRAEYLPYWHHHSTAAAAPSCGFGLVDAPVPNRDLGRTPGFSYDEDRDEVLISVVASDLAAKTLPRLCAALLSREALSTVLTPTRLNGGPDRNDLGGLVESNPYVLRGARCMESLRNEDVEGRRYLRRLVHRVREQQSLLGDLRNGDGSLNDDVASELARRALGLFGTALNIYDLLDVDVTIELQLPEYSRNWHGNRHALLETLARLVYEAGRYGHYSARRVLCEPRDEKRGDLLGTPSIHPGQPAGDLMARFVLVGSGISRFAPTLEHELGDALPLQEDGSHFSPFVLECDVVDGWRRDAVAQILARMDRIKKLRPTRQAISLLYALLGSPYDVSRAINALGAQADDEDRRDLDLAELRYALSQLPPGRLVPTLAQPANEGPGIAKVVHALLAAEGPVSKAGLARAAGVDEATVGAHRAKLEAVGLLDVVEVGVGQAAAYRLRLRVPFPSERRADDAPRPAFFVDEPDHWGMEWRLFDAIEEMLTELDEPLVLDEPEVWRAISVADDRPPDYSPLLDSRPELAPWVDLLVGLLDLDAERLPGEPDPSGWRRWAGVDDRRGLELGQRPPGRQLSLQESTATPS